MAGCALDETDGATGTDIGGWTGFAAGFLIETVASVRADDDSSSGGGSGTARTTRRGRRRPGVSWIARRAIRWR
jgi:hypothetical protein